MFIGSKCPRNRTISASNIEDGKHSRCQRVLHKTENINGLRCPCVQILFLVYSIVSSEDCVGGRQMQGIIGAADTDFQKVQCYLDDAIRYSKNISFLG